MLREAVCGALSFLPDEKRDELFHTFFLRLRIISRAFFPRKDFFPRRRVYAREILKMVSNTYRSLTKSSRLPCTVEFLAPLGPDVEIFTVPEDFAAFLMLALSIVARGITGRERDPDLTVCFSRERLSLRLTVMAEMNQNFFSAQENNSFLALTALLPEQTNEILLLSRMVHTSGMSMTFGSCFGRDDLFGLSFLFAERHPDICVKSSALTERERGVIRILSEFLI